MIDKRKQGKRNRAAGARFELKVRKDLESKGWIISKWMNNVEFPYADEGGELFNETYRQKHGKTIPAKHKYRGPGIPMVMGTGFPDFITFRKTYCSLCYARGFKICELFEVIGVEAKSNGYLSKEEKEKCKWYLDKNIFSKILIAKKGKKRGQIEYIEYGK